MVPDVLCSETRLKRRGGEGRPYGHLEGRAPGMLLERPAPRADFAEGGAGPGPPPGGARGARAPPPPRPLGGGGWGRPPPPPPPPATPLLARRQVPSPQPFGLSGSFAPGLALSFPAGLAIGFTSGGSVTATGAV